MKKLFTFLFCIGLATQMMAVPARRVTTTVRMSDGTEKVIQLRGDETFHFHTTLDGVPVCKNEDGTWSVDTRDVHALWAEALTKRNKHRQKLAERTRRHLAPRRAGEVTNTKKGLLILVNFTDKKMVNGDNSQSVFDQMLNGLNNPYGKNYGSVREYFRAQSYGHFDINFDIVGPVTVSQKMSYYGGNDKNGNDKAPEQMVVEACKLVDSQVNFADYDWDGDGEVENIYITYAGYGEASFPEGDKAGENTVWPHQWNLTESTGAPLTLDGVRIDTYACGSELYGTSGTTLDGIGTMCHEYSHCLGLPDFYDTNEQENFGMCFWSVMDSGCYGGDGFVPAGYTAYERWFCGWLEPVELNEACHVCALKNIEDNPEAYIIYNNANRNEYYLLANHQLTGWDKEAFGHGMMITHVDYDANAWNNNTINNTSNRQRMTIIPADNKLSYDSAADLEGDLWPGRKKNTALTDDSKPAATLYRANTDGQKLMHKPITNIVEADGVISFDFSTDVLTPLAVPELDAPTDITADGFTISWGAVEGAESYNVMLTEGEGGADPSEIMESIIIYEDFESFFVDQDETADGSKDISDNLDDYTYDEGWTGSKVYEGLCGAKLGSSKAAGQLTTPLLQGESGELTLCLGLLDWFNYKTLLDQDVYKYDNSSVDVVLLDEAGNELQKQTITAGQITDDGYYFIYPDLDVLHFSNVPSTYAISIRPTKRIWIDTFLGFDGNFSEEDIASLLDDEDENGWDDEDDDDYWWSPRRVSRAKQVAPLKKAMVMRRAEAEGTFLSGITATTYTFTELMPGMTYLCQVQAVDANGNTSEWSKAVKVTLPDDGTGIFEFANASKQSPVVYDLSGRRLSDLPTRRSSLKSGIYIVGGKKTLIQ
ncbi:MAG: M6 family metalloprotease domain-containing protein [Bacteroidaceae bacterium]|nr:M6 family metalloprotease domain-containing protein [Bacteroidaceae bacterium]